MKWISLSIFASVMFGLAWMCLNFDWTIPAAVFGMIFTVLAVTALAEFWTRYADESASIFERRMRARYTSSVVLMAEAMRGLHPENVRLLNRFTARAVWDVRVNMETRERDVMLRGTNIHLGFVEYVLNQSRDGKLYPRNSFSEGSFEWDPYHQVSDRQQHKEFETWLASQLIVAREFGDNAPAVFLPPWTPEVVKEALGITEHLEYYTPPVKKVTKPLTDLERALPKKVVEPTVNQPGDELPLTPEDEAALARVQAIDQLDLYRKGREQKKIA